MEIKVIASGSTGNCYRISDRQTAVLLDAGIPIKRIQRALNFQMHSISGALITHAHKDHSQALRDLLRYGVRIYTSEGTKAALAPDTGLIECVKPLQTFDVGTFCVQAFDVEHDAPEPLGFVVTSRKTGERLLYFTDTYYVKYRFERLNYIMGECNYSTVQLKQNIVDGIVPKEMYPRLRKSHMSLETFLEFLKATDLTAVKQIYLLHLSNNNSNAELFKRAVQEATGKEVYVC